MVYIRHKKRQKLPTYDLQTMPYILLHYDILNHYISIHKKEVHPIRNAPLILIC